MRLLKMATAIAFVASATAAGYAADAPTGDRNFDFSYAPDGNSFVFYSYRGDHRPDIYVRTHGGTEKNLTARGDTWDIEPDFSPDGTKIIYASGPNMGAMTLRIMNSDGTNDRVFYDGDDNEVAPNWSPDGTKVIFSAFNRNEKTNVIYIANADGGAVVSLTEDLPGQSSNGSWSPDGQWILFSNKLSEEAPSDLYKMRPDGSHRLRLTNDALSQTSPIYSPDMKIIVFSGFSEEGLSDIYSMPAAGLHHGAAATQLSETDDNLEYFLSMTPDGKHLTFSKGDWDKGFKIAHLPAPW